MTDSLASNEEVAARVRVIYDRFGGRAGQMACEIERLQRQLNQVASLAGSSLQQLDMAVRNPAPNASPPAAPSGRFGFAEIGLPQPPEPSRYPHWTCRTHGDFDARVVVGCPECVREMRASLTKTEEPLTRLRDCWRCDEAQELGTRICPNCEAPNPCGERPAPEKAACNCEGPQKMGPDWHAPYCATRAHEKTDRECGACDTSGAICSNQYGICSRHGGRRTGHPQWLSPNDGSAEKNTTNGAAHADECPVERALCGLPSETSAGLFYLLSIKHSSQSDEYLTLWRPNNAGYTIYLQAAGKYTREQIAEKPGYYNGENTAAVPCEVVDGFAIMPGPGYDDLGSVVSNAGRIWTALLEHRFTVSE